MKKNYNGLKLTPRLFAEILVELFDGKQFERHDAIKKVTLHFEENGGIIENRNYIPVFKAAAKRLKEKGMVNRGYGIWVINYQHSEVEVVSEEKEMPISYVADKEIGSGVYAIYVYYYDAYRELAKYKGESIWECKVGRTDKDPLQRVFGQAGTCYPESPHLALIIHCNNSNKLESVLHSILKYKNRWLENAPGSEWFLTSPDEIEGIYNSLSSL